MDEMNALERQLAGVVRGAMRPPRPVDAAAIVRSATTASPPSRWSVVTRLRGRTSQAPTTGGFTMLSALKFAAAAVILALFGGFLLSGLLTTQQDEEIAPAVATESAAPETTSEPLAPSGIELLTPSTGATVQLVADGAGFLWSLEGAGRLVRFDPDMDETTEWTLADDFVLSRVALAGPASIAPAAGGGIWLAGPDGARLFDGDRFAQVIEAPEALKLVVEANDGSLWAATESGVVLHWDGSAWEDVGPERQDSCDWIWAIEVDSAGRLWVGGRNHSCEGMADSRLMVFDDPQWTRSGWSDASPLGEGPEAIMEMPDGSIWVATGGGLARFDGSAWTVETPAGGHPYSSLATSPDGSVWTHSDNRTGRVWRSDGAEWTKLDGPERLPAGHWDADLATIDERIFLGTPWGTYERVGDGWEPAWDVAPARTDSEYRSNFARLIATDEDELWIVDDQGVSLVRDGAWSDELNWTTEASPFMRDLALGPDGTVWVAGPDGVAYRDGDRWEFVDGRDAWAIAVDARGAVWAARMRKSGRCHVWSLREAEGSWVREDIDGCPLQAADEFSMAVDGDGTVWLGGKGGWWRGGLARFADGEWETIDEVDGADVAGSTVLGADPDGVVWALVQKDKAGQKKNTWIVDGSMARLSDGDDIQVVGVPDENVSGWDGTALAPDGMPWTMSERGPARFDGQMWQFPYEDIAIPGMQVGAIGVDGSFYGVVGGDVIRYPARPS